jgi:hypothetical protein
LLLVWYVVVREKKKNIISRFEGEKRDGGMHSTVQRLLEVPAGPTTDLRIALSFFGCVMLVGVE